MRVAKKVSIVAQKVAMELVAENRIDLIETAANSHTLEGAGGEVEWRKWVDGEFGGVGWKVS